MPTDTRFQLLTPMDARDLARSLGAQAAPGESTVFLFDQDRRLVHGFVEPGASLPSVMDEWTRALAAETAVLIVSNRTGEQEIDRPDDELVWEEMVGTARAHDVVLVDWLVLAGRTLFSIAEHAPTSPTYDADDCECECCRLEAEGRFVDHDTWLAEHFVTVRRNIEQHGFMIQAVLGSDDRPPWTYTIGFLELGHPEVIVFGLDPESATGAFHRLYREILDGRRRPVGPEHDQHLADGDDGIRLLPVPSSTWTDTDHLNVASAYYGSLGWEPEQLQAVQLVWAAPGGHLPWDDACPERFRRIQPILDPEVGGM